MLTRYSIYFVLSRNRLPVIFAFDDYECYGRPRLTNQSLIFST